MIKTLIIFSLCIIPSLTITNDWASYTSKAGEFTILSPGTLREIVNTVNTPLGQLQHHIFIYQDNDENADNLMYMVSYCDYPAGSIHNDSTELVQAFLDATIEESTNSVAGQLIYANDIQLHGYPGKIWRVDFGNGEGVIRTKAFIKENRFYTIQTACNKKNSLNTASGKFMDSFYLVQKETINNDKE